MSLAATAEHLDGTKVASKMLQVILGAKGVVDVATFLAIGFLAILVQKVANESVVRHSMTSSGESSMSGCVTLAHISVHYLLTLQLVISLALSINRNV